MISRVLVVDDEPLARERLISLLRAQVPAAQVREAGNGDTAVEAIRAWQPEVVFLDVQMPGRDGFEVVAEVGADRMPPTVFVTAFDQHAIRAFDVAAIDYLLKPFDDERFKAAWQRVAAHEGIRAAVAETQRLASLLTQVAAAGAVGVGGAGGAAGAASAGSAGSHELASARRWADRVVVKKDQRTIVVKLADVQWMESSGNYVVLHSGRDVHQIRETLAGLESRLDPQRFVRIHRRVIVAIDAMKELQPWFGGDQVMILKDGGQLRVSRSYRERLASQLAGMG